MTKENKDFEKIFDDLLTIAAKRAEDKMISELQEKQEEVVFSEAHEEKMQKLFKKEQRKIYWKKLNSYSKRVACILLVAFLISGISMMSVGAWRTKLMNFFFNPENKNTTLHFNKDGSTTFQNEGILMHYIPYGFQVAKHSVNESAAKAYFTSNDQYFCLSIYNIGGTLTIDTENATKEEITINDFEAVLFAAPDHNYIVWNTETEIFSLKGNITKKELIKIAENSQSLRETAKKE